MGCVGVLADLGWLGGLGGLGGWAAALVWVHGWVVWVVGVAELQFN